MIMGWSYLFTKFLYSIYRHPFKLLMSSFPDHSVEDLEAVEVVHGEDGASLVFVA